MYDLKNMAITECFWDALGKVCYCEDVHERQRAMHDLKQMYVELSRDAELSYLRNALYILRHDDMYDCACKKWQTVKEMTTEEYDTLLSTRYKI